jgi:chromosome segregation ATPase
MAIKNLIQEELKPIKEDIANIKGQQQENNDYVKAVLHRTEELDAKFESLLNTTVSKEAIARVDAKLDTINTRLFNQS